MKIQKILIIIFLFACAGSWHSAYSQTISTNVNKLAHPEKVVYKKLGLAWGTLGITNLVFGINNQDYCLGFSIGFLGVQTGAGISVISQENIELNLLLNASYIGIAKKNRKISTTQNRNDLISDDYEEVDLYFCFGPSVEFNLYGFHTQFGLGLGLEPVPSPPVFIQIGYTYRWGN